MKIAYLILAHHMPGHLQRLVTALSASSSSIFIHLDKKSKADDFSSITGDNIYFIQERISVFWGDFSKVEATLILIRAAFATQCVFDRFVFISGADYPLRSAAYIASFLESNRNKEFMNLVEMPNDDKPFSRLTTYNLSPYKYRSNMGQFIILKIQSILSRVYKRDYKTGLGGLIPYGGSEWWALSREACEFILNFVAKKTQVVNFFKNTILPDESLFHTILGNSTFRARIVRNLTYADWSVGGGGGHPACITEKHLAVFGTILPFIVDSSSFGVGEMLFARKFSDESDDLVTRLENQIKDKEVLLGNRG